MGIKVHLFIHFPIANNILSCYTKFQEIRQISPWIVKCTLVSTRQEKRNIFCGFVIFGESPVRLKAKWCFGDS